MKPRNRFEELGFRRISGSVHASRTLMVNDLDRLIFHMEEKFEKPSIVDYQKVIIEDNILAKPTAVTRKATFRYLRELYSLDRSNLLFRALHNFSKADPRSLPQLSLLVGLARDPFLKITASTVHSLAPGNQLDRGSMLQALENQIDRPLTDSTLDKITRNCASSWTQSGHLLGRTFKKRQLISPHPGAVAMALLLGFIEGIRGEGLFRTFWVRTLDLPPEGIVPLAITAADLGIISFRAAGDVVTVAFPNLFTAAELSLINE